MMIFGVFLIILGALGAPQWVNEKLPVTKPYTDIMINYRGIIGGIGLVVGLIWFFDLIMALTHFVHAPLHMVVGLLGILLMLGLSLILGYDFIIKDQKPPYSSLFINLAKVRSQLVPYERQMSQAAIILGLVYFFVVLF